MAIPALTDEGLLPPGIHDCIVEEVRERFGRFQSSNRRMDLCKRLEEYMKEACFTGFVTEVMIDGSFVTAEQEPGDIDLIVVLTRGYDSSAELRPFESNLLSRGRVRRRWGFDIFAARDGSKELFEYVGFFQQVKGQPEQTKGILRVRCDHGHE